MGYFKILIFYNEKVLSRSNDFLLLEDSPALASEAEIFNNDQRTSPTGSNIYSVFQFQFLILKMSD